MFLPFWEMPWATDMPMGPMDQTWVAYGAQVGTKDPKEVLLFENERFA